MSSSPVLNPDIPYVGEVEGGLFPGKMVKVQGKVPPQAVRFAINFQLGPNLNPRDDIAIHVSPRFPEGFITRNHIESMSWGTEENEGPLWLTPGQEFEIIILCDSASYKIAINGRHFTEFAHRLPYQKVSHLVIDGDVEVISIRYEGGSPGASQTPRAATVPDVPPANFGPPGPGGLYPTLGPQEPVGPPGGGYQPPGRYGPGSDAYGGSGGYNPPRAYGYQPGYGKAEEEEEESGFGGGCLDKVGLALGGLVAVGGVAAAMHALNKNKEQEQDHDKTNAPKTDSEKSGGFGGLDMASLGTALASSLAAGALSGDTRPIQQTGYPSQDSNSGGGVLGSILGALGGGGGGGHQPSYAPQQSGGSDPLGGALGSILGGVFGGGGNQQSNYQPGYQPNYQPGYQPSGGYNYQPAGGYPSNQGSDNSNLLSGIGSALGSSFLNSALDGLSKHGKDKSQGHNSPAQGPVNYGAQNDFSTPQPVSRPAEPAPPGGGKLSAAEISRGLGLSDDED